jgi:hypothetical protein
MWRFGLQLGDTHQNMNVKQGDKKIACKSRLQAYM